MWRSDQNACQQGTNVLFHQISDRQQVLRAVTISVQLLNIKVGFPNEQWCL